MADEQYVIDVTLQAVDKTSEPLAQAQKHVSEFDKAAEQTAKRLQSLSRTPFDLTIRAVDRASGVVDKVFARGRELAAKPIDVVIRAKDLATAPIRGLMNALTSYQTYMLGFMAAGVGAATIAWPIKLADNLQQANIAFTTMLGSQQKAAQFMQQVQQFAIQTPFSTEDIVKNAQFMMALGFQASQVIPTLQAVGDAASAMGGSADLIQRILLALGQMQAHGKVDAQDMLQLTSANIPAWQILANSIHKSVAETQKLAAAGKLDAAPAVQAIIQGMEKLYGGQMQANANKTFSGLMSQITDTFKINVVTRWGQGIEHAVLPALAQFNDWLGRNQAEVGHLGDALYSLGQQGAQWVVDKVKALMSALDTLVNSRAWQQADTLGEKLRVAWDQVIVAPFDQWWQGRGQQQVAKIAASIGQFLGATLNGVIMGALGMATPSTVTQTVTIDTTPARPDPLLRHLSPSDQADYLNSFVKTLPEDPWVSAGQTAGTAFFNAFAKAFDADKIAHKLVQAFGNIQPSFLGGNTHSTGGDLLSLGLDLWLFSKGWKIGRGVVGWVKDVQGIRQRFSKLFGRRGSGGGPTGGAVATVERAAEAEAPKLSGLVDRFGRPIPSVLSASQKTAVAGGWLSRFKAFGRRIPGLNLLFGGLDVMSAMRASTRDVRWSGVGGGIGSTVGSIAGGALGSFLGPVGTIVGGMLGDVVGGFLGRNIGRLLSRVDWSVISKGIGGAFSAVKSTGGRIVDSVGDMVKGIGKWIGSLPSRVSQWFSNMRDKALQVLQNFRSGVSSVFSGLWGAMAGPLQTAANGVVAFVNAIIKAVNWVASKFGLGTIPLLGTVSLVAAGGGGGSSGGNAGPTPSGGIGRRVQAFAKGVTDWHGGLALVGEEGPELVYLPPHSSVLPNPQTRRLIPGFKNGLGNFFDKAGDVINLLMQGPKALAQAAMDKFVQPPQLPGVFAGLGSALLKWATGGFVKWIENNLPKIQLGAGGAVANSKQVSQWLLSALQATGTPASWLPGLLRLVGAESSGNPLAVNPTPVGGEHATGLLQMLPSTFREYAIKGLNNILDPVANAAAAIQYIKSRYGSVYNTPLFKGGPYKGYANGGVISEPVVGMGLHTGAGYLIGERGPEQVVPVGKQGRGAAKAPIQVNVSLGGVSLPITVPNGDPQSILEVLKAHVAEIAQRIADPVAEEIGKRLEKVHANLPTLA